MMLTLLFSSRLTILLLWIATRNRVCRVLATPPLLLWLAVLSLYYYAAWRRKPTPAPLIDPRIGD